MKTTAEQTDEPGRIAALQASIRRCNNGYLFTPTGEEIKTARAHPGLFSVAWYPHAFPFLSIREAGPKPAPATVEYKGQTFLRFA